MSETTTKQDTRYFHVENCNRHVLGDGHRFTFEPYENVGGCWFGVLATSDPEEIAALEKICADKKSAVTETDAAEFSKAQKKKSLAQPNFGPSRAPSARAFTGDASDVASLSGQVPNVDPDVNVPEVPTSSPSTPDAAGTNIGQVAAPVVKAAAPAAKPAGNKAK